MAKNVMELALKTIKLSIDYSNLLYGSGKKCKQELELLFLVERVLYIKVTRNLYIKVPLNTWLSRNGEKSYLHINGISSWFQQYHPLTLNKVFLLNENKKLIYKLINDYL